MSAPAVVMSDWLPDPEKETPESTRSNLLPFLLNDHGNACRLIALYREYLRYCHAMKKWLVWDGKRWAVDETDQARRLAKQTMLEFLRQAIDSKNEAAEKFARNSLDAKRVANMLSMAESEIFIRPCELDTNPYLLNFLNGTVDLRTGELRSHDRADFITKLVHHKYHPHVPCARFLSFLYRAMGASADASEGQLESAHRMVEYIQDALGYSLTGCTIEKAVFVLFGAGDNGKSTLLTLILLLFEEYSALLQADTLMVRQESNNSQADLADLRNARFVMTSETEEGQRLAQGKLKRLTQGMGKIKAVRKYENPIEFPETHKLWIDTNRKPTIKDADDKATFNRLHPIPFLISIPKEEIDRQLPAKLLLEAEGILAWCVQGAKRWCASGLNRPAEVDAAREQWHDEVDQVGRFIAERCVVGDSLRILTAKTYSEYRNWAEAAGERENSIVNSATFKQRMTNRFEWKHTKQGDFYLGIGLSTDERGDG